ncbi:OmpH family outer membrane protein [Chryseobacterium sp. ISL-6]|uniref:OmpH family outer membrane protein n=1 Tax=Chryseobacterium sp. ISL-6 TaxID=2819143 RepID=UPI001BE5D415|nr:OmpH family outer membrane protein [Chryseobacterium sp. ISL-6]MBT2619898.1 OmpH family outer membrane protein [Chryseobacterium sp. ISL-6]
MKNFKIAVTFGLFLLFGFTNAQKIGVIDTRAILDKMPQYKEAEARLNAQIDTWKSELLAIQTEYAKKKSALDNERVLLVGDQLKQREKEVADLDKNIKTTTSLRFGNNGEVSQLKKNLAVPFEEQIHNAVMTVSEKNGLGTIIDKKDSNVLYHEKKFDYTEKVLDILLNRTPEPEKKDSPTKKSKR